jgi:hypothetical protein
MIDSLAKVGNTTAFQSPQDFAATVKADIARWAPIVQGIRFHRQGLSRPEAPTAIGDDGAWAALWPGAPVTPPPGCAPDPQW